MPKLSLAEQELKMLKTAFVDLQILCRANKSLANEFALYSAINEIADAIQSYDSKTLEQRCNKLNNYAVLLTINEKRNQ